MERNIQYLAHIADDGREQTVEEHLQGTGEICGSFAKSFNAEEQGRYLGLTHDLGKYSDAFQNRLKGGHIVDHSTAGAYECAKNNLLWAACCVSGHHSGLLDVGNPRIDNIGDGTLCGRIKKAASGQIPSYQVPKLPQIVSDPPGYGMNQLTDSFIIRMLFSCLVDADYLDTEQFMSGKAIPRGTGDSVYVLKELLDQYIAPWWTPANKLNERRCEILRSCIEAGQKEKGLFTLTVPTGGGKTIASMAFALNHAVSYGMERIIYVIPYTSIIEQTADIFRKIFGEKNVLEHHSNACYEVKEGGENEQYDSAKATENWDIPIVVTTSVQFFESLYSNRSSKCRKLHNITNSVLIFDEAQMLPTENLLPCVSVMSALATHFNSTVVLCTATQPALNNLFKKYAPGHEIRELCPNKSEVFRQFRRVCFDLAGKISQDNLVSKLLLCPQVLCIVNSRKYAQDIFDALPEDGAFHLSTLMYPAHRRRVLDEIRRRLKEGQTCRVVSTSLIEAGVDVDFPLVYRELAGLDSILQAAGRCNREGKRPASSSIVTVFEGISATPRLLATNIAATREVLIPDADPGSISVIDQYFKTYLCFAGTQDRYNVISAFEEGIQGRMYPFQSVAKRFHMIGEATKTVYIPLEEGAQLIKRLLYGERTRELFRRLGQYGVNVYDKQFDELLAKGQIDIIDDDSAVLKNVKDYSIYKGLCTAEASTAVFI